MNDLPASSYDGTLERTADGGVIRFERHLPVPDPRRLGRDHEPGAAGRLVAAVRRRHHRRPPRGRRRWCSPAVATNR